MKISVLYLEFALSRFHLTWLQFFVGPIFPLATFEALREDRVMEVVYFPQLPELVTFLVIEVDLFLRSCDVMA